MQLHILFYFIQLLDNYYNDFSLDLSVRLTGTVKNKVKLLIIQQVEFIKTREILLSQYLNYKQ